VPGRGLARTLAGWLAPRPRSGWHDLPASVTATTGTSANGTRVHIVHNWNWAPTRVKAAVPLSDVLTVDSIPADAVLELGAWDVRVLAEVSRRPGSGPDNVR
jgi:beta-galactosidase